MQWVEESLRAVCDFIFIRGCSRESNDCHNLACSDFRPFRVKLFKTQLIVKFFHSNFTLDNIFPKK